MDAHETIGEAIRINNISILLKDWLLVHRPIAHKLRRSRVTIVSFIENLDGASAALVVRKRDHPVVLRVLDRKFNFVAYRVVSRVEVPQILLHFLDQGVSELVLLRNDRVFMMVSVGE